MHSGSASVHVLNGGPHIAANILLWVVHVADINLAFDGFTSAFRNGSIIGHKLRLIDSLGLPVAPAEEGREASSFVSIATEDDKLSTIKFDLHGRGRGRVCPAVNSLLAILLYVLDLLPTL